MPPSRPPLLTADLPAGSGEYHTAYSEMRRHRVNLNLLVGHAPETFPARCDDICAARRHDPSRPCVFVSELRSVEAAGGGGV